jgi:hypothetical protein
MWNGSVCNTENTRNAQKVEYRSKFEPQIKNILGLLSGAYNRWVRLAKPLKIQKSHASVPLKTICKIHSQRAQHICQNLKAILP